ncbi:MAG TPA: tetratricopeptide repeat protein [bacterium]|nr:tetratricopeptide repeat protein [bacterium]HNT65104.1 tetratricopeptide repeat protein [bacterium]HOX86368.1 tetratricopeptide repeat protein [bacterium]HPG45803.1 tetratricopeptide repeat protein [bacterium]HPM97970.1 tetratricopeptide repeat protein [bacterium]
MRRIDGVRVFWALLAVVALISCSSSRKDSGVIYDEDLTRAAEEPLVNERAQSAPSDEDEVLRLLGLSSDTSTKTKNESQASAANLQEMEARISEMQKEISDKNVEVANLKAELAESERRVSAMQVQETVEPTTTSRPATTTVSVSGGFSDRYQAALQLYETRNYNQALQVFDQLLQSGGDPDLLDNCQYWKGECYYGLQQYHQAIIEFEKVFAFKGSNKVADAQLKLGLCHQKLGNLEKARAEFETLLSNYPDSDYVAQARRYLQNL